MKHRSLVATLVASASLSLVACSVHGSVGTHHEPLPPEPPPAPAVAPVQAPGMTAAEAPSTAEAEVVCFGEDLKIVGRRIEGPGVGVLLDGSCDIVLRDCVIDVGSWAIVSRGSGDIVLENSFVRGGQGAVSQSGSGDIAARNTRFVGMLEKSGSGDFADNGTNHWE